MPFLLFCLLKEKKDKLKRITVRRKIKFDIVKGACRNNFKSKHARYNDKQKLSPFKALFVLSSENFDFHYIMFLFFILSVEYLCYKYTKPLFVLSIATGISKITGNKLCFLTFKSTSSSNKDICIA